MSIISLAMDSTRFQWNEHGIRVLFLFYEIRVGGNHFEYWLFTRYK